MSRVDCFHSFIKGERERERDHRQFLFGAFIFAPSKAKKKGEKWTDSRRPCCIRALSHPHHRLHYYLSISISRAQTRPRVPRVPLEIARRAHCVRGMSTFLLGWTSSRRHSSQSLFLSALFFEIERWHSNPKRFGMMTQKCAHRIPLFFGRRDRRDRRATRKNDATPFHARYTRVVRGKKGKRKSAAYHCFVLACEASK